MSTWLRRSMAIAGGLTVAVCAGEVRGCVAGAVTVVVLEFVLRRVESPQARRDRLSALADLPIAADLLAAALRCGSPPDRAALAVGEAMGGPVGSRLTLVARSLRLGATPATAWAHLADLPGGARLARAAIRSAERGTVLTSALHRQAADLRMAKAAAAEGGARRAGVLIVVPLGACFLPAFVLDGVLPVAVGVLHGVFTAL